MANVILQRENSKTTSEKTPQSVLRKTPQSVLMRAQEGVSIKVPQGALKKKTSAADLKKMQEADFKWFLGHYQELFNEYGNIFLVIKNKQVIGKFPSYAEAIKITKQREELGSFIVQECTDSPKGFTNYVATIGLTVI